MAATQYSDYAMNYYNNYHHQSTQHPMGYYPGQYESNNSPTNGSYNINGYNSHQTNYNHQWNHEITAHQHQLQPTTAPHLLNQSMLANDDYMNYVNNGSFPSNLQANRASAMHTAHPQLDQPAISCNQYLSGQAKDAYKSYAGESTAMNESARTAKVIQNQQNVPHQQVDQSSKKRKMDRTEEDSPALRALLSKPPKRGKYTTGSPYFYQSYGNLSPISSSDNSFTKSTFPSNHYASLKDNPHSPNKNEDSLDFIDFKLKEGYETKISAASLSPIATSFIATPPTSPKDDTFDLLDKNAESVESISWNAENGGEFREYLWNHFYCKYFQFQSFTTLKLHKIIN